MQYHCSACHLAFASADEPTACPRCHAEAGLEPQHGVTLPVKLFGALLAGVIVAAMLGGMLGRLAG